MPKVQFLTRFIIFRHWFSVVSQFSLSSQPFMSNDNKKAHWYMHLSIILWGFTGVLGRGISLSEGLLVWWRMLLVSISVGLQILLVGKSFKVPKVLFFKMAGIGILLMIHWLFFYGAIKYSNISITLSCFATTSLFTALLEPLVTKKKFNAAEIIFSLLGIAGIGFIFFDGFEYALGIFLSLMAAFVGSFFNIFNKNVVSELSPDVVSFYEMFTGFVVLTLFMPVYFYFFPAKNLFPTVDDWWLLIILAVICTHITLILSLAALKQLNAFTLNLAINLEPVYGIALAFIFFNENKMLKPGFYIGSAVILLSVVLHAVWQRRFETK